MSHFKKFTHQKQFYKFRKIIKFYEKSIKNSGKNIRISRKLYEYIFKNLENYPEFQKCKPFCLFILFYIFRDPLRSFRCTKSHEILMTRDSEISQVQITMHSWWIHVAKIMPWFFHDVDIPAFFQQQVQPHFFIQVSSKFASITSSIRLSTPSSNPPPINLHKQPIQAQRTHLVEFAMRLAVFLYVFVK